MQRELMKEKDVITWVYYMWILYIILIERIHCIIYKCKLYFRKKKKTIRNNDKIISIEMIFYIIKILLI
jgi:hypothetical protein